MLFALAAGRPLTRAFLLDQRATMAGLAPSIINVRLAGRAQDGHRGEAEWLALIRGAANLTEISNVRQRGTRLGNWLTREQARKLLTVPNRSTLNGKRDYAILALLVGCALRKRELASL